MTPHSSISIFPMVPWTILHFLARRWTFFSRCLAIAGLATFLPREALAHAFFTTYIQHQVQIIVGAQYIDVTVDLTFFEEWSASERRQMDANGDGQITQAELDSYLKRLEPQLAAQVRISVAGSELALVPLYEPEVDLLGNDKVGPWHHRLRLLFFAPTPTSLRPTDVIVIEDGLWSGAKAIVTLQAEGHDGCVLKPEMPSDVSVAPAPPGGARRFTVRCLRPPATPIAASLPPASVPLR